MMNVTVRTVAEDERQFLLPRVDVSFRILLSYSLILDFLICICITNYVCIIILAEEYRTRQINKIGRNFIFSFRWMGKRDGIGALVNRDIIKYFIGLCQRGFRDLKKKKKNFF